MLLSPDSLHVLATTWQEAFAFAGWQWGAILFLGLLAGILGGLLGVGGSVIMIPGLAMILGPEQHLYQAAAMIANVLVSLPAARRHHKAGATHWPVLKWMVPTAVAFVLLGVVVSNLPVFEGSAGGIWLGRILAVFLVYVIYANLRKLLKPSAPATPAIPAAPTQSATLHDDDEQEQPQSAIRSGTVGSVMGFIAGLLGIGGGAVAVPMQQTLLKLPLRKCIANSSVVICFSASIGALVKIATLPQHGVTPWSALALAIALGPTAFLGGRIGAMLTHRLPTRQVRLAFVLLMCVAAWKMAAIPVL